MNYLRTAILLAGLTALFMGIGYLIGGASGATIALVIAAATNLFAYWNSDRMVFSFIAGLLALKWLSRWLEGGRWKFFGFYCLIAAAGVLLIHFKIK